MFFMITKKRWAVATIIYFWISVDFLNKKAERKNLCFAAARFASFIIFSTTSMVLVFRS